MDVASPVRPLDSDPYRLAAYLVGRHPGVVQAWQVNLRECAHAGTDWVAIKPMYELWPEIDEEPAELEEFDDALRELAVDRKADVGILVELHRAWDTLTRCCSDIVDAVSVDDRPAVMELTANADFEYRAVVRLSDLLVRAIPDLGAIQRLGAKIGDALAWGTETNWFTEEGYDLPVKQDLPPDLRELPAVLDTITMLDSLAEELTRTDLLRQMCPGNPVGIEVAKQLISLDRTIRDSLQRPEPSEPILEIDEQREALVFLGRTISYSRFAERNASGGLRMFLAMAKQPGVKLTYMELQEAAGVVVDDKQVVGYLSRVRSILTRTSGKNAAESSKFPRSRRTDRVFIKQHRKRAGSEAGYSLDIPPSRVRILS